MTLVPIILCGGAGTRLWPLSREAMPKPFMTLPDGETLLGGTARRACAIPGAGPLMTITNRDYFFAARDVYATIDGAAPDDATYLLEPFARNTAGAVTLGALCAAERYGGDAVLLVMPADHLIRRVDDFARTALRAADVARTGRLVTFGVRPTHPETGFGYIEFGAPIDAATPRTHAVVRFVEKPPLADAQRYLLDGAHVWNAGIFCFTADTLLAALGAHAPDVLDAARAAWQARKATATKAIEFDAVSFARMPDISLDYAVMEKARNTAVVQADFDWSDVGSWQAVSDLVPADGDGNRGQGQHVSIATRGTYVHAEGRIVATVGVDDLVIVDTDDAVLVAHRDHLQRVKEVVGELKLRGHESWRTHKTDLAAVGHLHGAAGGHRLQDQAHRSEAWRGAVAADAPAPQRALGRGHRRGARDARRRGVHAACQPVDVHPAAHASSTGESGHAAAGHHRGAMRRLRRRGRHRPLRRSLRAHPGVADRHAARAQRRPIARVGILIFCMRERAR